MLTCTWSDSYLPLPFTFNLSPQSRPITVHGYIERCYYKILHQQADICTESAIHRFVPLSLESWTPSSIYNGFERGSQVLQSGPPGWVYLQTGSIDAFKWCRYRESS
jgi:hypothetical protein